MKIEKNIWSNLKKQSVPVLLTASTFFHDMTFFYVYNPFPQLIIPLSTLFYLCPEKVMQKIKKTVIV